VKTSVSPRVAKARGGADDPSVTVRLTLDVSLSPDSVRGTLTAEDGDATGFEGWLGLAQAVATAAGEATIAGPALLGEARAEAGDA
jgi:hypothetical protein